MNTKQELQSIVNGTRDELEQAVEDGDFFDWLQQQLSIESVMRSPSGDFQGVEILTCYGGPTVRVDTRWGIVVGGWSRDSVERSINCKAEVNAMLEELY